MKHNYFRLMLLTIGLIASQLTIAETFFAKNDDGQSICYRIISEDNLTVEVTYYISNYLNDCKAVTIPSTVSYNSKQYKVIGIEEKAFSGCSSLTSIQIPESVTNIGSYAFADCSSLNFIQIPESVTNIGSYAFAGCSSLTSIQIPDGVTNIGSYAFQYCM